MNMSIILYIYIYVLYYIFMNMSIPTKNKPKLATLAKLKNLFMSTSHLEMGHFMYYVKSSQNRNKNKRIRCNP